jgi:hypothetical protein
MGRLDYDLSMSWFVGLGIDDSASNHSTFCKNLDRLLVGNIVVKSLSAVLAQPRINKPLSTNHFSVNGTLIEAWASMKSFKPKDGKGDPPAGGGCNAEADFRAENRAKATYASTTDTEPGSIARERVRRLNCASSGTI